MYFRQVCVLDLKELQNLWARGQNIKSLNNYTLHREVAVLCQTPMRHFMHVGRKAEWRCCSGGNDATIWNVKCLDTT